MATTEKLMLKAGRRVALHRLAEGDGRRVALLCHAAPGAGGFDPAPEHTRASGVTLLALDRPGYGGSDPVQGWPGVAAAADDAAEVLDQLGVGPVGVAGWSAGGRVALALAARRPDLVDRVAVLATPAPDEEVPWLDQSERDLMDTVRGADATSVRQQLCEALGAMVPADPYAPEARRLLAAGDGDSAALAESGAPERLGAMLSAAFANGVVGMVDDITAYGLRPWGFEPADVRAETLLVYGMADPRAPAEHGRWWLRALPSARLETMPDAGHLLVIPMWSRVLDHLGRRA